MFEITSFDEAMDRSWIVFQHNLADHLSAMRNDDILILDWIEETTVDGFSPWIQFLVWDNEFVRAEVSSNAYLAPLYTLAPEDEDRLCALGWGHPTHLPNEEPDDGSPAFFVDKEQRWADQIAAMTVTTLRQIWNVPHPSFLRAEMIGTLEGTDLIGADAPDTDPAPEPIPLDDGAAIVPHDPAELRDLVARTVEQALGFPPERDEDGDVILKLDDQPVFVIAHPDRPLVRVWVPLLYAVAGRTRAAENICHLTGQWPGIRFSLDEDRLNASIDVSGNPFVPRHLVDALDRIGRFVPTIDNHFATRFDGSRFADSMAPGEHDAPDPGAACVEEAASDLPPALMTLLHLDPNGSGALSAQEVAAICGQDRDAVIDFLRITKEQEISWRESAETARAENDSIEAEVCDVEARAWSQTHESLRSALREIALPDHSRGMPPTTKPHQMELFGDPTEQTLFDANPIEPPDHTVRGTE
ncbi:T3SS (YopN, CesT) and YbjN peptide-binding chaperone 1 [Rhodococcus sp. ACT016]|uniref:T3SS (YopN, CesT) and YbjN peptide-binding chaperone 1 n=1 Tax=Rhodococcus sp. ACT016 TaxID=3134808 RepID=UPI003D2C47A1